LRVRGWKITLGIVCATLVHSLVFPQSLGRYVWRAWTAPSAMRGDDSRCHDCKRFGSRPARPGTLAADMTELRLMSTHLPFDTSHLRWTSSTIHCAAGPTAVMVPVLSAVEDRWIR